MFVCPVNVMRRAIQFIIQTDGPDIELQRYCFPFYAFAKKKTIYGFHCTYKVI